jgi:hypothetical protein
MSPSISIRGDIRYRYYRCRSHAGGRPPCPGVNIAAMEADSLVKQVLMEIEESDCSNSGFSTLWRGFTNQQRKERLSDLVDRVFFNYAAKELTIQFKTGIDSIIAQLLPGERTDE